MSGIIEAGSELDSESGVQGELQGVRNDPIEQSESESPNFNGLTSPKLLVIVLTEIEILLERRSREVERSSSKEKVKNTPKYPRTSFSMEPVTTPKLRPKRVPMTLACWPMPSSSGKILAMREAMAVRAIPQPHPSMKRVSTDKNGKRKCWSSGIKYSTP